MEASALPPLPRTGPIYLLALLVMIAVFYALLVASLVAVAVGLIGLVLFTAALLRHAPSLAAIEILVPVYGAALTFAVAIVRGLFARSGGVPDGIRATRTEFPHLFALTDEVSRTVGAAPFHDVYLVPDAGIGVTEEAALYLPPGMGRRILILGMAALSSMTLDQLRGALAHELGHFANRDVFAERFVFRVTRSYGELLANLGASRLHLLNPVLWVLWSYHLLYSAVAASFSRVRELYADRCAVEAYGREVFAAMLAGAAMEGTFFSDVGVPHIMQMASNRMVTVNLYREIATLRAQFEVQVPDRSRKILGSIMTDRTGLWDSHPSDGERMRAQGVPTALLSVPPVPRLVPGETPGSDVEPAVAAALCAGPPSAAESLFGRRASQLQRRLGDLMIMRYHQYRAAVSRARAAALDG